MDEQPMRSNFSMLAIKDSAFQAAATILGKGLVMTLLLSSCGLNMDRIWARADKKPENAAPVTNVRNSRLLTGGATVDIEKLQTERPRTSVEVVWKVPMQEVEGFLIRYGFAPGNLQYEERVDPKNLEPISDPQKGSVYRYVLQKIPEGKKVYVTVSSFRGSLSSQPSEPIEEVSTEQP